MHPLHSDALGRSRDITRYREQLIKCHLVCIKCGARVGKLARLEPSRKIEAKAPSKLYRRLAVHASNVIKNSLREKVIDHLVPDHPLRNISATRDVRIERIAKVLLRL